MAKHSAAERAIGTPATSKKTNAALNRAAKEGANGAARYALPVDGSIPAFLLVKNRKKPTKAEQARIDAFMGRQSAQPERVDWRKPKGLSWEDWDAIQARAAEERRAKTDARITALKEKQGPPKPKEPRVPGYKGHNAGSRKARVHECFDVKGAAAATKLGGKLGLKEGTIRSWIKSWDKEAK